MAGSHEGVESWLPDEFLGQEEQLMDKGDFAKNGLNTGFKPSLSFPPDFPYEFDSFGFSSNMGSPVESMGSIETESSEEDDFLIGLTRRLTQQLAVKSDKWVTAGSPESTLSGIGSWSVSSNGSPNGVLSPPTTPFGVKNDTWDLIYAAAGQVARLKMGSDSTYSNYQGRGLLGPARSPTPEVAVKIQNTEFYSSQRFGQSVTQMNQYRPHARPEQMLRSQCSPVWGRQPLKAGWQAQHHAPPPPQPVCQHQQQQIQNRGRAVGCEDGRCVRPLGLPQSAWPPPQVRPNQHHHHRQQLHHSNSGMRAVFLGGSGAKRESAGTGVFLPRRYGNPAESKKKSACSAVLLPAKVIQALNLNLDDMNISDHGQPRFNTAFGSDYDTLMARRKALLALQMLSSHPEAVTNHEIRLPQEWTY